MPVLAVSLQPGLAIAIGCGTLAFDASDSRPDPEAIGKVVMVASLDQIVACAKLAGVVTLRGFRYPDTEHPEADAIRAGLAGKPVDRACLWVFEMGICFEKPIPVRAAPAGAVWSVPVEIEDELRAAYRAARERRAA